MPDSSAVETPSIDQIIVDLSEIARKEGFVESGQDRSTLTFTGDTTMSEAGLDSLGFIDLLYQIEDKYQIKIELTGADLPTVPNSLRELAEVVRAAIEKARLAA